MLQYLFGYIYVEFRMKFKAY